MSPCELSIIPISKNSIGSNFQNLFKWGFEIKKKNPKQNTNLLSGYMFKIMYNYSILMRSIHDFHPLVDIVILGQCDKIIYY